VNRQLPNLGSWGNNGVNRIKGSAILEYFLALATRLRRVRVCCGDWSRIVTDGALSFGDYVGIFLDPPYDEDVRGAVYNTDNKGQEQLSHAVRDWAIAAGKNPRYRLCWRGMRMNTPRQCRTTGGCTLGKPIAATALPETRTATITQIGTKSGCGSARIVSTRNQNYSNDPRQSHFHRRRHRRRCLRRLGAVRQARAAGRPDTCRHRHCVCRVVR